MADGDELTVTIRHMGRVLCELGFHRWMLRSETEVRLEVECVRCGAVWYCSHDGQTWWQEDTDA